MGGVLEGGSDEARDVVSSAGEEARRLGHARVGTEHLLLGLLATADSAPAAALRAGGATLPAARHMVSELAPHDGELGDDAELGLTERAQRALERAGRFSRRDRQPEVTAGHVLLGVLDVEGLGCQVLRGLGVDLVRLRDSATTGPIEATSGTEAVVIGELLVEPVPTRTPLPRCPACNSELVGNLVDSELEAQRAGGVTRVGVISCATCGTAIGAYRAQR